jgi:hypothetical protein
MYATNLSMFIFVQSDVAPAAERADLLRRNQPARRPVSRILNCRLIASTGRISAHPPIRLMSASDAAPSDIATRSLNLNRIASVVL